MAAKAQVALEYAMLLGFVLVALIPLVWLFHEQSEDITVEVRSAQLQVIGQRIIDAAESVYYLGAPSRAQLTLYLPEQVRNVTVTNKALIFSTRTAYGPSVTVVPSRVNMTGALPKSTGLHVVTVENRGAYVFINAT
ncbi:hypothetical protein HY642_04595 [Candidatus Woesearchaeota archaeon]|nr:hypothetical protein [Candidatus Woesearchaeota archaeon]